MEYLIPHYGSLRLVKRAVNSIKRTDSSAKIYIGDDTRLLTPTDFKHTVHIIEGPQRGFTANVNRLLNFATGDWIVIMNNDVELMHDWWIIMQSELEVVSPKTYCFASSLYQPDGRVDSFGDNYSWYGQGYNRFHLNWPQDWMYRRVRVLGATGALMTVRRKVLKRYGGFSEILGSYCEDTAFHLQANNDGWRAYYVPEARAIHKSSATFSIDRKLNLSARNSILLARSIFDGKLRKMFLKKTYLYWKMKANLSRTHWQAIETGIAEGLSVKPFRVKNKITVWPKGVYLESFPRSTYRLVKQLLGDRIVNKLRQLFTISDIDS